MLTVSLSLQIFHTVAIILLSISTAILLIGILVRTVKAQPSIQRQVPLLVAVVCAAVRNLRDFLANSIHNLTLINLI